MLKTLVVPEGCHCIDKDTPLFSVLVVRTPAANNQADFALMVSMSHMLGDGHTYYQVGARARGATGGVVYGRGGRWMHQPRFLPRSWYSAYSRTKRVRLANGFVSLKSSVCGFSWCCFRIERACGTGLGA